MRRGAASTVAALTAIGLAGSPSAWASGSPTTSGASPTEASLQVQAQELAGEIAADGRTLDELDASYSAAQIRYQALQVQRTALQAAMVTTGAQVTAARNALKQQAIQAYLTGDAPIGTFHPGRAGQDPSLASSYADIVAGGEKRAEAAYRATLATQRTQAAELDTTTRQADVTLRDIRLDLAAANATLTARRQTLAEVNGQLAAAVAQVQQADQQAQQVAMQAKLASEGQLPTGAQGATTAPPGAPTTTAHPTSPTAIRPPVQGVGGSPSGGAPMTTTIRTTPTTRPPITTTTTTPPPPPAGGNVAAPGSSIAIAYAEAQIGKPYRWAGAGPDSFDCSGLVMMAWAQAGVYFPHLAQDQYNMTRRIPLADLLPGDLVFFGTPDNVYHVGIYIGNGQMIDAPETGQDVSIQSIYWSTLLGGGRVQG